MKRDAWRIAVRLLMFPISIVLCLVAAVGEYADAAWHWLDHKAP
jgi:hypothetical protein